MGRSKEDAKMWILAVVVTLLAALSQIASLPPSTAPQSLKFDTKAWVNFASKFGKNPEVDMNSVSLEDNNLS